MTLQTIFDRMSLYDNQLDLISGGNDVVRGLTAVNMVQDWFELAAADIVDLLQTHSTLTTTASTETTNWPTGLLRLDGHPFLLDSNGVQVRELSKIDQTGGHQPAFPWPLDQVSGLVINGAPWEYYAQGQGGKFYWSPKPDAVYTIRVYGLWAVADYTAASDTFGYPDSVALTLVPHAAQVFRIGLDKDFSAQQSTAVSAFRAVAKALRSQVREGPVSRVYSDHHDT